MGKKIITPEQIEQVKNRYFTDKLSTTQLAKEMGCSHNTIARTLKREGLQARKKGEHDIKYSVNESYFDSLDSQDKVYFLGLLYADGYMDETNKGVKISLQEEDGYIIEKFKEYIGFDGPVGLLKSKNPKHSNSSYIQVYNRKFYSSAESKGLYTKKSLTLTFPDIYIPKEYISDFIRGYFDGDGCIHKTPKGKLRLSIVGTYEFLRRLQSILIDETGIRQTKISLKNNLTYNLQVHHQEDIKKLFDFMYSKKSDLFLTRKFKKFYEL